MDYLVDGPDTAKTIVILAHGAGAAMDTPFMAAMAEGLAKSGRRCVRFEFPYMAERRVSGRKLPPNRQPILLETWNAAINDWKDKGRLVIGGKSMGGRMASLIADESAAEALVCLGYPFHPPGKPEKLRTEHLEGLQTPTLMLQGERDTFGTREEVPTWPLFDQIEFEWLPDGDHSFKPRKASGFTEAQNLQTAVDRLVQFLDRIGL